MCDEKVLDLAAFERTFLRVQKDGGPRAVFLTGVKLSSWPAGGPGEARYLKRADSIHLGTYDYECTRRMLMDDLSSVLGVAACGTPHAC